mgnify:CR=1 FL=1
MKSLIKQVPLVGKLAKVIYYGVWQKLVSFSGSQSYWDKRYLQGGNSGDGSYSELALFKAEANTLAPELSAESARCSKDSAKARNSPSESHRR